MYAVISSPLVSRTRATLRNAEFGFFGVTVLTCVQTPRRCGLPSTSNVRVGKSGCPGLGPVCTTRNARVLTFFAIFERPLRTNWLMVGNLPPERLRDEHKDGRTDGGPQPRDYTAGPSSAQPWRRTPALPASERPRKPACRQS